MLALLQEAKDRHAAILADPFPDGDYDKAFSWAVQQSDQGASKLDEMTRYLDMMRVYREQLANHTADTMGSGVILSGHTGEFTGFLETMDQQIDQTHATIHTIQDHGHKVMTDISFACNEIKAQAIRHKRMNCMSSIDAASRAVTRAHRDILRAKNEASKWAALRRSSADSVALLQREYNILTTL